MSSGRKNRWILWILVLLFAGPIVVAYGLNVFRPQWLPLGAVHHGELIQPPVQLNENRLRSVVSRVTTRFFDGSWTLALVTGPTCDRNCQLQLIELQQLKVALGKDSARLTRLLVLIGSDTDVALPPSGLEGQLDVAVAEAVELPLGEGGLPKILLVDPQGYTVMRYSAGVSTRDILSDLKRLLKISKIG